MSPPVTIEVRGAGSIAVGGDLTADRGEWRRRLEACLDEADGDVVIDLAGLVDWDAPAQAVLFHIVRGAHARGRKVSITGLTPSARRQAHVSGMEAVLLDAHHARSDQGRPGHESSDVPPPAGRPGPVRRTSAPDRPEHDEQRRGRSPDGTSSSGWD